MTIEDTSDLQAGLNPDDLVSHLDFKNLVAASPVAFYTTDARGRLTFFNKAAADLWGRTPELGMDFWSGAWKVYYPDGTPMPAEEYPMFRTLQEERSPGRQRVIIERPDATFRDLVVIAEPIFDADGKLIGGHNTLLDTSEQQQQELKRARLSAIVESSDDAVISQDLQGIITSWNEGAERIFKYSEEEIIGKSIWMLIPEDRQNDEQLIMDSILNGERVDHLETTRVDKFGNKIPLSLTISPVKDIRGKIIGASEVGRDISERLQGEEKQAILSAIVESSDDAIVSKDLKGTIMSWNRGAEQIFGYTEEEVIGKSITILIPEDRFSEVEVIINKIKKGERLQHFQTIRKAKNGELLHISLTVSPIKDSKGNIIGASKIARDISVQVKTQWQLEKHTRHLEILNSIGKSISKKMDVQHILQQVTDATTSLTGAAYGAFFYNDYNEDGNKYMLFTLSGAERKDFEQFGMPRSTAVFHTTFTGEGIVRVDDITKDVRYGLTDPHFGLPEGHPPVKSFLSVPVISGSGEVIGGLFYGHPQPGVFLEEHEELVTSIASQAAISLDNSILFERVRSLSEKKDEFIALASHELKTPLTTIKGYLQVLSQNEKENMKPFFLKKSLGQVNKLNTLVEDLLNMSRLEVGKLEFNLEKFDLGKLLSDLVGTFDFTHKTHSLHCELEEGPVWMEGDKQRIEQAVVNLLNNAVKYSPKADRVFLKLTRQQDQVMVSVRDEGIGLTEAEQKKLFSRYYRAESTKGISGLGVGLYLTKEIVDRHQGKIEVESEFGKGSEFRIVLPVDQESVTDRSNK